MIRFDIACHTDIGSVKKVNQDSACAMTALLSGEPICMLVLCDGMGGASMGECASRRVVMEFVNWFEQTLPELAGQEISLTEIRNGWMEKLIGLDEEFRSYGRERGIKTGTTATCMLFWKDSYLLVQSGDSRAYEIGRRAVQLSEDQSYVQQQMKLGKLTPGEALRHPLRYVLTDCIGGSRPSVPVPTIGTLKKGTVYLVCSDGFVHEVREKELAHRLAPWKNNHALGLHESLVQLTEDVKQRGETDNITAVGMFVGERHKKKGRSSERKEESTFLLTEKLMLYESVAETVETVAITEEEENG